jgi:deoxyribonuclease V
VLIKQLHSWNVTPKEAIALQKDLASQIITHDCLGKVSYIAGVDVAIGDEKMIHAAVIIMTYPTLEIIEMHCHQELMKMPYIPGLLSFREIPALLGVFKKVNQKPDLIFVDGMGIAHPRGIGIASHLGLWLQIPTIGVGKKKLVGEYDIEALSNEFGAHVPLMYQKKIIGEVIRTRNKVKPLFISSGYMISLETSMAYVLSCCRGYRLPEPIRYADKFSKKDIVLHNNDMCLIK